MKVSFRVSLEEKCAVTRRNVHYNLKKIVMSFEDTCTSVSTHCHLPPAWTTRTVIASSLPTKPIQMHRTRMATRSFICASSMKNLYVSVSLFLFRKLYVCRTDLISSSNGFIIHITIQSSTWGNYDTLVQNPKI